MSAFADRVPGTRAAIGHDGSPTVAGRLLTHSRALVLIVVCLLVLGAVRHQGIGGSRRPTVSGVLAGAYHQEGLLSLPAAARGPVSAALGGNATAYRVASTPGGLRAVSPAERLVVRFTHSGVSVTSGHGQLGLALRGVGFGSRLWSVGPSRPRVSANRVDYAPVGGVRVWYANGPLGLEQGFDLAARPGSGRGPLTLSLALTGDMHARLGGGGVIFSGGGVALRYARLAVGDARGRRLRAWFALARGRVLIRVADRGARYPLRIDPTVQQAELTASDGGASDALGTSVAIAGSTIVVGAPYHLVGSNVDQGAAYVFSNASGSWQMTKELTASDGAAGDEFGSSVAVVAGTIVVGAPDRYQGGVYVFSNSSGSWKQTAEIYDPTQPATDLFGYSVAVSGSTIAVGAPGVPESSSTSVGEVYVFSPNQQGNWAQTAELTASDPAAYEELGYSVAISGNTIVAGSPTHNSDMAHSVGAVYVFTDTAGTWSQSQELTANDGAGGDYFGISVAISGSTLVAGAPYRLVGSNSEQGTVYVFANGAGGWMQSQELTAQDGGADDLFGDSVAISGSTIVAGAPAHAVGSNAGQGATYVFGVGSTSWQQTGELTAKDGAVSDALGHAVAASGSTTVAGAPGHKVDGYAGQGAAYVFVSPTRTSATTVKCVTSRGSPPFTCTATVGDTSGQSSPQVPTGAISFSATAGELASQSCTLDAVSSSAAACSVGFTAPPATGSSSTTQVTATYAGDSTFIASQGQTTVTIAPVVVNSTENGSLKSGATSCDTGATVTDSQGNTVAECTLRAAIQYVDDQAAGSTISFDIPGSGVPLIYLGTQLPDLTVPATIDGSTQPGGWVQLEVSGTIGPDGGPETDLNGLELYGVDDVVRGLVIGGFADGILASGQGDTIAGNRIGTDVTGEQADPNQIGISVTAPNVTIGGTTGTSTGGCTGDCNLISGNTKYDVSNESAEATGALGLAIQGDWIGIDAAGGAIPSRSIPSDGRPSGSDTEIDVDLVAYPAGGDTRPTSTLTLGGVTTRPGAAPGNVIAASGIGVQAEPSESGPSESGVTKSAPIPVIEGNTLGLDASGQRAAGHGRTGIIAKDSQIGGETPGAGNVIGGFIAAGANLTADLFAGNLVGTDLQGTEAVGNATGVLADADTRVPAEVGSIPILIGNVISGNRTGVDGSVDLERGNLVGISRDGESALPNNIGWHADHAVLDGLRTCLTDPCNVISGNHGAGILQQTGGYLQSWGTFVGTNRTGARAIPNGIGIRLDDAAIDPPEDAKSDLENLLTVADLFPEVSPGERLDRTLVLDVGGLSLARSRDRCEYPCNLVAGNHGDGLTIDIRDRRSDRTASAQLIQGNVFGQSADGKPLPNDGPDLAIRPGFGGSPLTVGGDLTVGKDLSVGNVFAGRHPLVELGNSPIDRDIAPILIDNVFKLTGAG